MNINFNNMPKEAFREPIGTFRESAASNSAKTNGENSSTSNVTSGNSQKSADTFQSNTNSNIIPEAERAYRETLFALSSDTGLNSINTNGSNSNTSNVSSEYTQENNVGSEQSTQNVSSNDKTEGRNGISSYSDSITMESGKQTKFSLEFFKNRL